MDDYFERQIIGWLAVLVGAFFLAKSVARRREKGQMRELLGLPTDKVKSFRNFFVQRLERIVGFVFVLVGVGVHLYVVVRQAQKEHGGNDPQQALTDITTYLAIACVATLFLAAAMHWICSYFARRIFLDILAYYMVRLGYRLDDDPALMQQIGDMLGIARREDDTVESYRERIAKGMRLDDIRARLLGRGKAADAGAARPHPVDDVAGDDAPPPDEHGAGRGGDARRDVRPAPAGPPASP
jgi:hypothetical protein